MNGASAVESRGARPYRVAYLVTHPIQYQAPMLRLIGAAHDIDLTVYFRSDLSLKAYHDPGFGREVDWDIPLLGGFRHEFLPALGGRDRLTVLRPLSYGIATRLWRHRVDALWVHGYASWFNWVAILAARLAAIPVFVRDEATATSAQRSSIKATVKRGLFFRLLRILDARFFAIGSLNRQYYLENGIAAARIFPMPYCVDNDYFARHAAMAASRREELRASLGLEPDRQIILFASKFQRRKRPADLLAAYRRLRDGWFAGALPYLIFVGDGELRHELEGAAQPLGDDVRFLGFRNQSELPSLFDLCDVFVLPSEREPWGLIVNEVMSVGRAVVASDQVGCAADLVHDGVNGFVYPVGNIAALATALGRVLGSRVTSRAMGEASRAIMARWSFKENLAGLRAALADACGPRPARDQ